MLEFFLKLVVELFLVQKLAGAELHVGLAHVALALQSAQAFVLRTR